MDDINGIGDSPIVINYSFAVTTTDQDYLIPGNFGTFLQLGRLDADTGRVYEVALPRHRLNPIYTGFIFQGNYIRFEPPWPVDETLTLQYIPNGHCPIHFGTIDTSLSGSSSTQLFLDPDPSEGYFDRTPNAYLGTVIRLLSSDEVDAPEGYTTFPIQERVITGYDPETAKITVSPAFDLDFAGEPLGDVTYEIVPYLAADGFAEAIAWNVASAINEVEGRSGPADRCLRRYQMQMRSLRSRFANLNARNDDKFIGDVPGTGRYGPSRGWLI
jgi:hypothetical protein